MRKQTPQWYEIRIAERIDPDWTDWFDGMAVRPDAQCAETVLSGKLRDQAALYGLLNRLRDLNLTLLAIKTQEFMQEESK